MSSDRTLVRRSGATNILRRDPMTMDDLRKWVPSVFTTEKAPECSDQYTHISTASIIEHLSSKGYGVFGAGQVGFRHANGLEFKRHMIRMRPLGASVVKVGDSIGEIVIVNGHDRSTSWKLSAGLFRLVCSNGLMVSDSTFDSVRIRHSGDIISEVMAGVERIQQSLPKLTTTVNRMRMTELSQPQRLQFASEALRLKYQEDSIPVEPAKLLGARRVEDQSTSLWNTFNTVQENLVYGGQGYTVQGRRRQRHLETRPVVNIFGSERLNRELWDMAARFVVTA